MGLNSEYQRGKRKDKQTKEKADTKKQQLSPSTAKSQEAQQHKEITNIAGSMKRYGKTKKIKEKEKFKGRKYTTRSKKN